MKLDEYRKKRDASRTNEPLGDDPRAPRATWRGAFVVHQHDATRLHYDLRLETAGVLASFAVPKGPTLDPAVKHFAARTEDHPIEYLDFEAIIPDGTYGAGPMIVWDCGLVRYLDACAEEGLVSGKLHFVLEGKKLRGRFALVRVKPRSGGTAESSSDWLLLKKADAFVRVGADIGSELPRSVLSGLTVAELRQAPRIATELEAIAKSLGGARGTLDGRKVSPMLCTLGEIPKKGKNLFELKLDGVRILATKDERGIDLVYRSGRSARDTYPEVVRAMEALAVQRVVLDGEIVAFDERGRPAFERLARRIHGERRPDMRIALAETPVYFVVFDLLALGALDVVDLPLVARKKLLAELIRGQGVIRVLDHLETGGEQLFAFCRENGLEGIVSKRADAPYRQGPRRTTDWIKTKTEQEALFVVIGYTRGENSRSRLGALDLGSYEDGRLVVRGKVGSGLDDASVEDLLRRLDGLVSETPTAEGGYDSAPRGRKYVRGELVVRVRFLEWSEEGSLRFPVFLGIEHDADPTSATARPHDEDAKLTKVDARASEPSSDDPPFRVRITNRQKLFFPADGLTKGDLVDYYDAIAPVILPYLKDRPVMLVRYPDGIDGKSFYQWNVPQGCPPWVKSVVLGKHVRSPEGDDAHKKHVFLVDSREALLYVANLACIPIHILASRVSSTSDCDFLTIDFDVNLASLRDAIPLATTLREILGSVGLQGFPKTSGQTGLHVFVPLGRGVSPEAARMMAELFGRFIVEHHPDKATMERVVQKRGPKVYVDTGQTGPSRTIVAPYSVRATPGAQVSTPLLWDEVTVDLDPSAFTIRTVPARVAERGDPMTPMLSALPDPKWVLEALERMLGARAKRS